MPTEQSVVFEDEQGFLPILDTAGPRDERTAVR